VNLTTLLAIVQIPAFLFAFGWGVGRDAGVAAGLDPPDAVRWVAVGTSVLALALCAPAVDEGRFCRTVRSDLSIRQAFVETLRNRPLRRYLVAQMPFTVGITMVQPATAYYATVILGRSEGYMAWLGGALFAMTLLAFGPVNRYPAGPGPSAPPSPAWPPSASRYRPRRGSIPSLARSWTEPGSCRTCTKRSFFLLCPAGIGAEDCAGPVVSAGFCLIEEPGTACELASGPGDRIGVSAQLEGVRPNGGPTDTALPEPLSPLVNGGDPAGCRDWVLGATSQPLLSQDQRGLPRVSGGRCDIGAVELVPEPGTRAAAAAALAALAGLARRRGGRGTSRSIAPPPWQSSWIRRTAAGTAARCSSRRGPGARADGGAGRRPVGA